jgi:hypothetical protein
MRNKGSFIPGSLLSPQYEVFMGKFLRMQHQAAGIEITTAVCGYTDSANSKNAKWGNSFIGFSEKGSNERLFIA